METTLAIGKLSAILALITGIFQLYVGTASASARRKRVVAETKERIEATRLWYQARTETGTLKSEDAELVGRELLYVFSELERTRVERGRAGVIWFRRWLLLYALSTKGGRFMRSWAFGYLLFMPAFLAIRAYDLWRNPNHPLSKDWTTIIPPHFFSGPWSYWLIVIVLFVSGNVAELYPTGLKRFGAKQKDAFKKE